MHTAVPQIVPGERGFDILRAATILDAPRYGHVTGAEYPFDRQRVLLVDRRDTVYLLSGEVDYVGSVS